MKVIADLQIHSRFSRATSKNLDLQNLEKYARIKGLNLLGTGDFTHPKWIAELKENLTEDGSGILTSKSGFKFTLQGEISLVYTQGGKGRRIHHLLHAPNFEVVDQITQALLKKGRVDYDGRPIFGFSSIELVEMMRDISHDIEIVPAHVWTPWFGMLGSKSGFDSVKECFQDQTKHIHAIETGLSADPAMCWRISELEKYTLLSSSDAHSFWPWRLGRECNIFDIDWKYKDLLAVIRQGKGFLSTIEFWPDEGKYHYTGHRNCGVVLSPKESLKRKDICPKCKKPLTVGVAQRIEVLADKDEGYKPKNAVPFKNIISLSEVIAGTLGRPVASKKVWEVYDKLISEFGNEMNILLDVSLSDLKKIVDDKIALNVLKNREQKIEFKPGYDGVYGVPVF